MGARSSAEAERLLRAGAAVATQSPLAGKRVVVLGAGGAGRALAFGAAEKGAHVIVANRYSFCGLARYTLLVS